MRLNLGSIENCMIDSVPNQIVPKIGDGATVVGYTDRHAATVIGIRRTALGNLVVTVQYDTATRTDNNGMSESQSYAYTPNPNGQTVVFYTKPDGVLRERNGTSCLRLGKRDAYHDFSF